MSSDGGDVDGMSSCESETEVVEDVENQRGASSGTETKFSDGDNDDGMSSGESETEVVEGVENQRGALHSSSDPPADLSLRKSKGKCHRHLNNRY